MKNWALALSVAICIGCADQAPDDEKTLQRMSRLMDSMDLPGVSNAPTVAPAADKSAAPVGNLLAGLEQRLTDEPNDASGWALLAQSYAFVGRDQDASDAVQRAVALGMNEAELTARVDKARKPHQ